MKSIQFLRALKACGVGLSWIGLLACNSNPVVGGGAAQVTAARSGASPACQVGGASTQPIALRLMVGKSVSADRYRMDNTCDLLNQVFRHVGEGTIQASFLVSDIDAVDARFNRVNNHVMNQVLLNSSKNQMTVVVADAIMECGTAVGYILGCAPRIGYPLIFVKSSSVFGPAPPDHVIWAHEMGHAFGLRHPDGPHVKQPLVNRLMTYMPGPDSKHLLEQEVQLFNAGSARVASAAPAQGLQAQGISATAAAVLSPLSTEELVRLVSSPGAHGIDLDLVRQVSQASLLELSQVVRSYSGKPGWKTTLIQANALVLMGLLGREQVQSEARSLLTDKSVNFSPECYRYAFWALEKGQYTHPTHETRAFLVSHKRLAP